MQFLGIDRLVAGDKNDACDGFPFVIRSVGKKGGGKDGAKNENESRVNRVPGGRHHL